MLRERSSDYLDGGVGNDQMWGGGGSDHEVGVIETEYPPELINLVPVSLACVSFGGIRN
jgi:Ca2+-binding RTX toxin-like protein